MFRNTGGRIVDAEAGGLGACKEGLGLAETSRLLSSLAASSDSISVILSNERPFLISGVVRSEMG